MYDDAKISELFAELAQGEKRPVQVFADMKDYFSEQAWENPRAIVGARRQLLTVPCDYTSWCLVCTLGRCLVILSVAKDLRAEHDNRRWLHSLPRCFTSFSMTSADRFTT